MFQFFPQWLRSLRNKNALLQFPRLKSHSLHWLFVALTGGLVSVGGMSQPAAAQMGSYCETSAKVITQKATLRQAAVRGDREAQKRYQALIAQQADQLRKCRNQTWPSNQAIWIRLYPCDLQPGVLEAVLDRIVERGYNQVYVEVFSGGRALLPAASNRTVWPSVVQTRGAEKVDLLAQAIQKGRERGMRVYAWMFTLNFGVPYAQRPERQAVMARNGKGQVTLSVANTGGLKFALESITTEETFADPYSPIARSDYLQLVQAIAQRKPDGILFDYIRYPKGTGTSSLVTNVKDLWIYSDASQQTLFRRAANRKGQELIQRYVAQGYVTGADLAAVNRRYPQEGEPQWQGRSSVSGGLGLVQQDLWFLTAAHAVQGILDFLTTAAAPVQRQGLPAGAVFFPEGNQVVGQGFDSRLQAWDRFPSSLEWHPMAYGTCGNTNCITAQIQRVLSLAPKGTTIKPVLAGIWGQSVSNRPPLEVQMQALQQRFPKLTSVSHFAYSWQEPASDQNRKFCRLN